MVRDRLRPILRPWLLRALDAIDPPEPTVLDGEHTPNPDARRFRLRTGAVVGDATVGLPGAASVFVGPDFVTITRQEGASWAALEAGLRQRLDRSR